MARAFILGNTHAQAIIESLLSVRRGRSVLPSRCAQRDPVPYRVWYK